MHIRRKARDPLARRPGLQPSSPRPWDPPQTQFPGIVPISTLLVGQSDRGAIAITSMSAYTNGFGFVITRLVRPGTPGWDEEPFMAQSLFEISLRLSHGRTVSTGRPADGTEPAAPFLRRYGGGGSSHYNETRWWAWPLPPSGPLEFICQWPGMGISETRVSLEAGLILDAARRSVQVWPEPQA
jgi:hypothetical protein